MQKNIKKEIFVKRAVLAVLSALILIALSAIGFGKGLSASAMTAEETSALLSLMDVVSYILLPVAGISSFTFARVSQFLPPSCLLPKRHYVRNGGHGKPVRQLYSVAGRRLLGAKFQVESVYRQIQIIFWDKPL